MLMLPKDNSVAPPPDNQDTLSNPVVASIEAGAPSDGAASSENGASPQMAAAPATANDETADVPSVGQPDATADAPQDQAPAVDASLEIDHRRAKQLLDRSLLLSERGDFAGAILAARQAVVLTPTSPTGHSMLGLLHERAGDLEKAIASYEKVLQLAPQSTLERDNVERLKATVVQENASVMFHFNDNELFEEPESLPAPPTRPSVKTESAAPVVPVAAPVSPKIPISTVPQVSTPAVAAAAAASKAASAMASPTIATPRRGVSGPPVMSPLPSDYTAARQPVLQALSARPSFYFKAVPLVATTALGMLFMSWAQGVSQSKRIVEMERVPPPTTVGVLSPKQAPTTETVVATQPVIGTNNPAPPPPGTATGNNILGRGQGAVGAPAQVVVSPPSSGGRSTSRATTGSTGTGTAPLPPTSTAPLIPQPATSSGSGTSGETTPPFAGLAPIRPRSDSSPAVRPAAPVQVPAASTQVVPAPAAPVAPGDGGGNSRGGGLFNPGSQPRGVIRVDPVRPMGATASRPANVVRRSEASAAAAAAQGNSGRVVSSMSDAIQRLPSGYAYQRRAMAFLDQADYSRAADDFQSAIGAYNEQINRNQDVEEARNGLRTSQSGLRMAINNMRR